jgi:hypothetical protein
MKRNTITLTLSDAEFTVLEKMFEKYSPVCSLTSCAHAAMGVGLAYYIDHLKIPLTVAEREEPLFKHCKR